MASKKHTLYIVTDLNVYLAELKILLWLQYNGGINNGYKTAHTPQSKKAFDTQDYYFISPSNDLYFFATCEIFPLIMIIYAILVQVTQFNYFLIYSFPSLP